MRVGKHTKNDWPLGLALKLSGMIAFPERSTESAGEAEVGKYRCQSRRSALTIA